MKRLITENNSTLEVETLVFLKKDAFKKNPGKSLIESHHRFLILDIYGESVALPISSNMWQVTNQPDTCIEIQDYSEAGLTKPSYVDISSYGRVSSSVIERVVGKLSDRDAYEINREASRMHHLRQFLEYFNRVIHRR